MKFIVQYWMEMFNCICVRVCVCACVRVSVKYLRITPDSWTAWGSMFLWIFCWINRSWTFVHLERGRGRGHGSHSWPVLRSIINFERVYPWILPAEAAEVCLRCMHCVDVHGTDVRVHNRFTVARVQQYRACVNPYSAVFSLRSVAIPSCGFHHNNNIDWITVYFVIHNHICSLLSISKSLVVFLLLIAIRGEWFTNSLPITLF